jgi:hypothetical protein
LSTIAFAAVAAAIAATAAVVPAEPREASAQPPLPYRLALGQVARDGTNPTNQDGFATSVTIEKGAGQATVRARVVAEAAGQVLVDIETYDHRGRRIDQQWQDHIALAAGQAKVVTVTVRPPDLANGPFTVKVGVFEPGQYWGALLHWNNAAATFSLP